MNLYINNIDYGYSHIGDMTSYNFMIFTRNKNDPRLIGKVYYTYIINSGVYQKIFIPVIRKSDNKPGLYVIAF